MKNKQILIIMVIFFAVFLVSCDGDKEINYYIKSFFIAETTFEISGEVFINDNLTEKASFNSIIARTDSVSEWEVTGSNTTDNKFELTVDIFANGVTISEETIDSTKEGSYFNFYRWFPKDFQYCLLYFVVDNRRSKGARESEFEDFYYYIYVVEAMDLSKTTEDSFYGVFGGTTYSYYHIDMNFEKPGWYKIYYSQDNPIGNKPQYSSATNTKIRALK